MNCQWLGLYSGRLFVGYVSGFVVYSLQGGEPLSKYHGIRVLAKGPRLAVLSRPKVEKHG